jgi:hypothetical protein
MTGTSSSLYDIEGGAEIFSCFLSKPGNEIPNAAFVVTLLRAINDVVCLGETWTIDFP